MNTTFLQFLPEHLRRHNLPPELGETAATVVSACVQIGRLVRLGALAGVLGTAGSGNVQGEEQKKLDVLANDLLIGALRQNSQVAGLASGVEDSFVACRGDGRYLVLFDLWDGSSNIDVNISGGTLFPTLPKPEGRMDPLSSLQRGEPKVAAGYVLYGRQTACGVHIK